VANRYGRADGSGDEKERDAVSQNAGGLFVGVAAGDGNGSEIQQSEASGDRWFALRVRPRHESRVSEQLAAKDCGVFLPQYSARRKWADRWKVLTLPLFPGYVFCRFDANRRGRILATPGVIDVVRNGSEPAPIEAWEMDAIQRVASADVKAEPYPELGRGERVMVRDGPLEGVAGVLMQVKNSYRLVISVELLRRSVQVEIERHRVIPCGPRGAMK